MNLVMIIGPPAVGKMAVGAELARLTGLRLFHNHMTIDLVVPFFPFGTPPFGRLVTQFRHAVFEEVAASELPGLIFTYVWGFEHPAERPAVEAYCAPFASRGANIGFLELYAPLEERLRRNSTELRLAVKPSKRDLEHSRQNLLMLEREHRLNSDGDFPWPERHLRIDNTDLSPAEVARRTIERFRLPQAAG